MLESIRLINFQTHRKKLITFDPRITTIIGPSDAGKSSVLRALQWALLNQFDGPADSFIRWGAAFAKVAVVLDGQVITRRKGNVNSYELDGKEFKAFGAGKVPDPLSAFVNLTEANFQRQLDQHFWFSESASTVSRELNQIVNLGAIDDLLSSISTKARRARTVVDVSQQRLQAALDQQAELAWVRAVDVAFLDVERVKVRVDTQGMRIRDLRTQIEKMTITQGVEDSKGEEASRGLSAAAAGRVAIKAASRVQQLRNLIRSIEDTRKLARAQIRRLPRVPEDCRGALSDLINRIESVEEQLCENRMTEEAAEKEIHELTEGLCPICRKPV